MAHTHGKPLKVPFGEIEKVRHLGAREGCNSLRPQSLAEAPRGRDAEGLDAKRQKEMTKNGMETAPFHRNLAPRLPFPPGTPLVASRHLEI